MGTRARAAQSALYYERLLEMKDEQLAMRTRLSAAASAPKPEPSQRALEQLVQKLTAERDAWRGRSRAAAESEAAALRAALSQEARRREELVEAYNGALVAQHERAAACADCDVDRREWQIERQLRREECEQLRADLAESAAEGAALRREVRALQEKLLALFSAQMSADGQ